MREDIRRALAHEPDYFEAFTKRIAGIRERLSASLGIALHHNTNMNYSVSQRLQIYIDPEGHEVDEKEAAFRIDFFMSSRADFFVYKSFCRDGDIWAHLFSKPQEVSRITLAVCRELEREGWVFVEEAESNEPADGYFTEMDNVPANVFQVLFSELV